MVALASAEEAVLSAAGVVRESSSLLLQLLPQALDKTVSANTDMSVPATNLRQYKLYQQSPPTSTTLRVT